MCKENMFSISFIMMIISFLFFVIVCNINMEEKLQEKIKSILFIIVTIFAFFGLYLHP